MLLLLHNKNEEALSLFPNPEKTIIMIQNKVKEVDKQILSCKERLYEE